MHLRPFNVAFSLSDFSESCMRAIFQKKWQVELAEETGLLQMSDGESEFSGTPMIISLADRLNLDDLPLTLQKREIATDFSAMKDFFQKNDRVLWWLSAPSDPFSSHFCFSSNVVVHCTCIRFLGSKPVGTLDTSIVDLFLCVFAFDFWRSHVARIYPLYFGVGLSRRHSCCPCSQFDFFSW